MIPELRMPHRQGGRFEVPAAIVGLAIGGAVGWYFGQQGMGAVPQAAPATPVAAAATPAAAPAPAPVRYGFEADQPLGWTCGNDATAEACVALAHFNDLRREGVTSMKMEINLSGGHGRRAAGEAWVDVNQVAPAGHSGPLNLAGRTVKVWAYGPPGAVGDESVPNGVQLFLKDGDWTPQYGSWHDIKPGQWVEASIPVRASEGFDPTVINAIGIKVAAGEGSKASYKGPIYVDAVSW